MLIQLVVESNLIQKEQLRLTEHYSFKEQDVVRALNASKKRIDLSKKENELTDNDNPDQNKKKDDNDVILEMAIDWLSLHLNESDLHAGFRTRKRKPSPGTSISSRYAPASTVLQM